MAEAKKILVQDSHPNFDRENMFLKEFASDFTQIRYYTLLVVQQAPSEIKEINLLEQQISELIKNAIKHGNRGDKNKVVKVWYQFSTKEARLIIQDEGEGFQNVEEWNRFNGNRQVAFQNHDYDKMMEFVSYRTERSDENDGGNALFAAVEYWDGDFVLTSARNTIGVRKIFRNGTLLV